MSRLRSHSRGPNLRFVCAGALLLMSACDGSLSGQRSSDDGSPDITVDATVADGDLADGGPGDAYRVDDVGVFDGSGDAAADATDALLPDSAPDATVDTVLADSAPDATVDAVLPDLGGDLGSADFPSVAALLADTSSSLSDPVTAQGTGRVYSYSVAPAGATDHHVETAGGVKLYANKDTFGARYSEQLGWTAGQDISKVFRDFIQDVAAAGDIFVLGHSYVISALTPTITFPDDFMLAAEQGAKVNIVDTKTSADGSDGPPGTSFLLDLGHRNVINNVVFDAIDAPNTGTNAVNPIRHTDFHSAKIISVSDKDDVTFYQTEMRGNVAQQLVASGNRLVLQNSLFEGGYWMVSFNGSANDFRVHQSVFKDSLGDGIKTTGHSGGTLRPLVTESLFEGNNRDAIDTTNGFADGVIRDSIFRNNNFTTFDFKNHFEDPSHFQQDRLNRNILVEDCLFLDSGNNTVVLTTLDNCQPQQINNSNAPQYIVKDVTIQNSIVQLTDPNRAGRKFILSKDAHDILWDNIELLGHVSELKVTTSALQQSGVTNTNYNLSGTNVVTGPIRSFAESTSYPFPYGQGVLTFAIPAP